MKHFLQLADGLEIRVIAPFRFRDHGEEIIFPALVKDFGGPNGTVILDRASYDQDRVSSLTSAGYGYSLIEDIRDFESNSPEDLADLVRDWGWNGRPEAKPTWL